MDTKDHTKEDNVPVENVQYINELKRKITEVEYSVSQNLRTSFMTITNFELSKNERMWQMKKNQQYIDAIIVTEDGHQEHIHLDQLLSIQNKIKDSFKSQRDVSANTREYKMDSSIRSDLLKEIVYFAYHGKCHLNKDSSLEMANFAEKYYVTPLLEYCINYFFENCDIFNSIKAYQLCTLLNKSQTSFFKKFIEDNFETIIHKNKVDIIFLEFKHLLDILKSQKLNLINEEIVWYVIQDWVLYDKDNRINHFESLFKESLRIGRLRDTFLKNVILQSEVYQLLPFSSQQNITYFIDALIHETKLTIKDGHGLLYSNTNVYFKPRESKYILIAAGGWVEGQTTHSMEIYDYQTNLWIPSYTKLPKRISYFGLQVIGNTIYVFGGSNGREIFKTMDSLCLNTNKWEKRCSMIENRCYVSSVVLDDKIYAIGGFNTRNRIRRCEVYNPRNDSWREIAELNYPRSDASAEVLNGRIYVAGGINDTCIEKTVEVYYPEANEWKIIKTMISPRTSFAFTSFQNKIWAVGGNDGSERCNSCEAYDPETDSWSKMPSMISRRSTFRCVVMNDELYACGGYNGQSPICNVEKFSPNKGWTPVRELKHDRSGLSLLKVPNIFEAIKI